jgi:chromosome segregation ATPase
LRFQCAHRGGVMTVPTYEELQELRDRTRQAETAAQTIAADWAKEKELREQAEAERDRLLDRVAELERELSTSPWWRGGR